MVGPLKDMTKRKYQEEFIKFGFTSIITMEEERPQCMICCEVLSNESFKVNKLIHLKTKYDSLADCHTEIKRKAKVVKKTGYDNSGSY
jgi:hypothetical protein